jgi:hypothetical protein
VGGGVKISDFIQLLTTLMDSCTSYSNLIDSFRLTVRTFAGTRHVRMFIALCWQDHWTVGAQNMIYLFHLV